MQFALAYQTASADTEAELRSLITGLHVESDSSKELVLSLQAELEKSQQKVIELEEQLRWQELEKQNQLNIKEAKIQELLKGLNISSNDPKVLIKYCIKVRENRKARCRFSQITVCTNLFCLLFCFSQQTNKIRSFVFGRIYGVPILFWFYLTFS